MRSLQIYIVFTYIVHPMWWSWLWDCLDSPPRLYIRMCRCPGDSDRWSASLDSPHTRTWMMLERREKVYWNSQLSINNLVWNSTTLLPWGCSVRENLDTTHATNILLHFLFIYTEQKAIIRQVTIVLATSKNVLCPGHNHLLTTSTDDLTLWLSPKHQRLISTSG